MTRPLRIQYPGAMYHISSRGDRREPIFTDDQDRRTWLNTLGEVCDRYDWRCYAWCQMNNHYHIVVETLDANLSAGMRFLNGVYTQSFNYRHDLTGHVYQGRYHSTLVDRDSYLLEVCRYVVLNPVRAKLVSNAAQWRWSSHQAVIGVTRPEPWLNAERLLHAFARRKDVAVKLYEAFVDEGCDTSGPWKNLSDISVLGDDNFIEAVRHKSERSNARKDQEVSRLQRKPTTKSLDWFAQNIPDKREAMALAFESGAFTMKEIAHRFDVHYTTVSRAVRAARRIKEGQT